MFDCWVLLRTLLTGQCSLWSRENVIELQRSHMEEMERASELLQGELRKKEVEYEQRLLQLRRQQTSKLRWDGGFLFLFWVN